MRYIWVYICVIVGLLVYSTLSTHTAAQTSPVATTTPVVAVATSTVPVLTHQQEVWLYALEWCESRGVSTAVNPNDRDGTPSYYSFQFKPGTFKWLVVKYGILSKGEVDTSEELMERMKSYDTQRTILKYMLYDKTVKWENQFPTCVKVKVGRPPLVVK